MDNRTPTITAGATDMIHRPFFLAGIATVLTLGCVWGAINLLTIGVKETFSAVNYSWILAHGHAMVFGFVGFFIMGFAYQAFPRFKQTTLFANMRAGKKVESTPADVRWVHAVERNSTVSR